MTPEQTEKLIELLEHIRLRPGMYTGMGYEPEKIDLLLLGIRLGQMVLGFNTSIYGEVVHNRGWEYKPVGLVVEMRKTGYSDEAIVNELIDIEIEVYKRFYRLEEKV